MFLITLAEKGGGSEQLTFEKNEVTIGRLSGNDIVLAKGNVSKYHSRIVIKDGKFIIVDMKSTNGTYVNGKKIAAPQVIRPTDKIYIGDYIINVEAKGSSPTRTAQQKASQEDNGASQDDANGEEYEGEGGGEEEQAASEDGGEGGEQYEENYDDAPADDAEGEAPAEEEEPPAEEEEPRRETRVPEGGKSRMPASMQKALERKAKKVDPKVERYARLQKDIHDRLIEYLDLRRLDMDRLGDEELWRRTEKAIKDILDQMEGDQELPEDVDREELLTDVLNEALGLGPLEAFIANEEISEMMVN